MAFGGNVNVTISAINTAGGIVCSRTSGTTPCFIQVSASAITATGTSAPYEDLEYTWDFGDASGVETFTQPLSADLLNAKGNISVNANSAQTGPEAAYVYRSAGTYTVTLTIRGCLTQSGGVATSFTTATVTQSITVSAFSPTAGEFYLDSVNGSDSNSGTSSLTPKKSKSNLVTWLAATQTGPVRINLARGSNWTDATLIEVDSNFPVRIQDYGAGAKPIIGYSGTSFTFQVFNGAGSTVGDIVVSNIELYATGTTAQGCAYFNGNAAAISHIYLDNVDLISDATVVQVVNYQTVDSSVATGTGGTFVSKFGIWGGLNTMQMTPNLGPRHCLQGGALNWMFVYGQTVSGAGSAVGRDHHFYTEQASHWVIRYVNFGQGPGRDYAINGNIIDSVAVGGTAPYFLISDCVFGGPINGIDLDNTANDPSRSTFDSVVIQRNSIAGLGTTSNAGDGYGLLFSAARGVTFRDNLIYGNLHTLWACDTQNASPAPGPYLKSKLYRNSQYDAGGVDYQIEYINGGTFANPQTITDNIQWSTGTGARQMSVIVADQVAAGSLIDRNKHYAPSDSDGLYLFDSATGKTFAQWQALGFDVNGTAGVNPGWANPANGDFSNAVARGSAHSRSLRGF